MDRCRQTPESINEIDEIVGFASAENRATELI